MIARMHLRVLITGSRDWTDEQQVRDDLELLLMLADLTVVHGACPTGADAHAHAWCQQYPDVAEEQHPADWAMYGRAAGPCRNVVMVGTGADLCLAYIRNNSRGAHGTARTARTAGIPVYVRRHDDQVTL
jgi:YspA, cpYpsA-related SLOG family